MSTDRRVLVTGGAGYLGSRLTEALLARGAAVVVLDNFTFTDVGIRHLRDHPALRIVEGDIRDDEALRRAMKGIDSVIHLAAIANDPSGELDPELTRSVNFQAYFALLEEARRQGVERFLNASTFSVYGIATAPGITEEHPLNPLKEYSICKADSEQVVRDYNSAAMTTVSIRCATICGWSRRMRFDLIANTLVGHAINEGRIVVLGGQQQRPQIHIEDLCDLFLALLDAPAGRIGGAIFNAGGENLSILEIAEAARQVVGHHVALELALPRDDERSYSVSSEKLARTVGFRARRSVRDAMNSVAQAYQQKLWCDANNPIYHNVRHMGGLRTAFG